MENTTNIAVITIIGINAVAIIAILVNSYIYMKSLKRQECSNEN